MPGIHWGRSTMVTSHTSSPARGSAPAVRSHVREAPVAVIVAAASAVAVLVAVGAATALRLRAGGPSSPATLLGDGALRGAAVAALVGMLVPAAVAATVAWRRPAARAVRGAARATVTAAAAVAVALAAAQAVGAAALPLTVTAAAESQAAVVRGSALRVDLPRPATPAVVSSVAGVEGVADAAGVRIAPAEASGRRFPVVAMPAGAVLRVVTPVAGAVDPALLHSAVRTDSGGLPLGVGATGLRLTLRAASRAGVRPADLRVSAVLTDSRGTPARVTLDIDGSYADGDVLTVGADASLPRGRHPWTLDALTVSLAAPVPSQEVSLTLVSVRADDGLPLDIDGAVALDADRPSGVVWLAHPAGPDGATPVPAAVSASLAAALGARVGDTLEVAMPDAPDGVRLRVAATVPAIPGADGADAVLVSLGALSEALLQQGAEPPAPNAVFAAGRRAAAPGIGLAVGEPVRAAGSAPEVVRAGALAPAAWYAVAGAGVLAVMAAAGASRRLRAAPGAPRRTLSLWVAAALAAGAGGAVLAVPWAVPAVIRATAPMAVPSVPVVPVWSGTGLALALAILTAALVAAIGVGPSPGAGERADDLAPGPRRSPSGHRTGASAVPTAPPPAPAESSAPRTRRELREREAGGRRTDPAARRGAG